MTADVYPDLTEATVLADTTWTIANRWFRLLTILATFPRFILAEVNTHRQFSRNSASSRAIPIARQIELVKSSPFVPQRFPVNQPGMSAAEYIGPEDLRYFDLARTWLQARDEAVHRVEQLVEHNVHKQIANRLLEPFMWHQAIISATFEPGDWPNFFDLRISPHAQPEINTLAVAIKAAADASTPRDVTDLTSAESWHLPLIGAQDESLTLRERVLVSVARVAAVSYNRHLATDVPKELARTQSLAQNRHLSPFEHIAHPWWSRTERVGNFTGWMQVRRYVETGTPLLGSELVTT